uniref:Translation elongation factor 1 n=1 Tax=Rhizophora mucronata TaxID=61149 RepID=A0A2P2KE51_RHIMU
MLTGLAISRYTSLKATSGRVNDEDSTVGLGSPSYHILDKVTMSRSINDCAVIFGCLKLPQGNINGDTTLTLSFQLVKHPGILE